MAAPDPYITLSRENVAAIKRLAEEALARLEKVGDALRLLQVEDEEDPVQALLRR